MRMLRSAIDIPVLVVAFKRHEELEQCLSHLVMAGIRNVFVSVDAPRNQRESAASDRVRKVLAKFSDVLNLKCRFAETNQGCRRWVSSSIGWFFEQVDFGVIVEEDILIDQRFFGWCLDIADQFDGNGEYHAYQCIFSSRRSPCGAVTSLHEICNIVGVGDLAGGMAQV